jgi:hypothetical protein
VKFCLQPFCVFGASGGIQYQDRVKVSGFKIGKSVNCKKTNSVVGVWKLVWLGLPLLFCGWLVRAQEQPFPPSSDGITGALPRIDGLQSTGQAGQEQTGTIVGKVVDQSGTNIPGALVKLTREGQAPVEVTCDGDGLFAFTHVVAGAFHLTISSPGLQSQDFSGTVQAGERFVTPVIMLTVAKQVVEVHVGLPPDEIATEQIKEQEKQRVFGIIPNFYVSYVADAAPLRPKHKFELAWKSASDPITLVGVGALAGIDQAADRWGAYGQGAEGYAKRYGATYVNVFAATFIGGAIMPSLLKQDPRYFYRGTGTKKSRFLYAIANSVICKGDNGQWQPNYSNVIGAFGGAGLQALYYPPKDRQGAGFVIGGAMTRLAETSLAAVLQEFVLKRFTPNRSRAAIQP